MEIRKVAKGYIGLKLSESELAEFEKYVDFEDESVDMELYIVMKKIFLIKKVYLNYINH